jgi:tetratricopeptide (TPR) repeat protein
MLALTPSPTPSGNRPWLDPDCVLSALDSISHSQPLGDRHPLLSFLLIRDHLAQVEQLGGEYGVLHGVSEILERCLLDVLGDDRRKAHDPLQQISRDMGTGDGRHAYYSLLYYRYLRADLELTLPDIDAVTHFDERTRRRYQKVGLAALTLDLIEREVHVRRQHRERVLRSRIPYSAGRSLYGREPLVLAAVNALLEQIPVLLVGIPGVGKTSLAAEIAHQVLAHLDDLYWINLKPQSEILPRLAQLVVDPSLDSDLLGVLGLLATQRSLVVLDNLSEWHFIHAKEQLVTNLYWLCTAWHFPANWHGMVLEVPPLEAVHARRFFEVARGDLPSSAFDTLYHKTSGIPGTMLHSQPLGGHPYFGEIWSGLPTTQRMTWLVLLLTDGLSEAALSDLTTITYHDLLNLVRLHILKSDPDLGIYRITDAAAVFIKDAPPENLHVYYEQFINTIKPDHPLLLVMLANGLADYIPVPLTQDLLIHLSRQIKPLGLWADWSITLTAVEEHLQASPYWLLWHRLEKLRISRWQGFYADTYRHLQDLINEAGGRGFWDLYAHALLELATIALHQHRWQVAAQAAEDAEATFYRLKDETRHQAVLLRARAVLDNDPSLCLQLLQPYHSAAALQIASEAYLKINDPQQAVDLAYQALQQLEPNTPNYGRTLSSLAIALHADQEFLHALDAQQQAINILSLSADQVGLSRAYNNLAVIYTALAKPELAQDSWETALSLALSLQDVLGLQTIRANMSLGKPPSF